MKKLLCLLLLIPTLINAQEVNNSENTINEYSQTIVEENIEATENLNGTGIYIGLETEVNNNINGILFNLSSNLEFGGTSEYGIIGALNANIAGTINNDGIFVGNTLNFTETFKINRDAFIFTTSSNIQGTFLRDVTIISNEVVISNTTVTGNLDIQAAKITIGEDVNLSNLTYNEDAEITIDTTAVIANKTTSKPIIEEMTIQDHITNFIYSYGTALFTFAAVALLLPQLIKRIETKYENFQLEKILMTLGVGGLGMIMIPLAALLLMSLVFGVKIGIFVLGIFVSIIFLTEIFAGYLLGYYINKYFIKKENNVYLSGLIGITIISVLSLIPVVSTFILIISILISLGITLRLFLKN